LALGLVLLPAVLRAAETLHYRAADSSAPAVTEKNLIASERFWPYHVALERPWPVSGGRELPAGWQGVLIRVEPGGVARIDFGSDGLIELPVGATDLVQRAERIRRGELDKMAPNFVLAIGPRLLDAASQTPRTFGIEAALARPGFLAVFDVTAAAIMMIPVLFPLGRHPDRDVRERLRALDWTPAYVFDHLADGYTTSLVDEGVALPALQLETNEGRVLFEASWNPDVVPGLTAALDAAFGASAQAPATVRAE